METQTLKVSLRDYFRILCYWKGTVIVLFLVISLTTLLGSFLLPPVYRAFALILVEREQRAPLLSKDYSAAGIPPQLSVAEERAELAKTQSEIIKSRHILEKVILTFQLDKNFEEPNRIEKAVNSLQNRIEVKVKEDTDIIDLSVEDSEAETAAKIANGIAEEYVRWLSEMRKSKTEGASGILSKHIEILDKELKETEDRMTQLKKEGDIATLKEEIATTVATLADFDAEYQHALADIAEKEKKSEELKEILKQDQGLITASQIVKNPVIDALKLRLLDLELKRMELLNKYNEGADELENIDEGIAKTKAELSKEITNVINAMEDSLKRESIVLDARKKVLEDSKDKYNKKLRELSDKFSEIELEYNRLERQVKGKNELYLTLLGKQAEASLAEAIESSLLVNVKIIDPAKVPLEPIRPKKLLNTILGCIVGLMSGIGGAFLKEYWDHSLKTVDEVRRYLELPALATIPRAKSRIFTLYTSGSPIAENFHTLSTAVQQICKENGINTLLVTSANHEEGKSVVSANLAMSLASIEGKRVLIVDANLRQPALHKFFEGKFKSNLVEILTQKKTIEPDPTDIKNLHLISTSQETSESSRLLASDSMKEFIKKIKTYYDYIIFDSPALISYPDASILGFELEGIILVINFGKTNREVIERAKSLLNKSQRKILGAVLNNVEYVIPESLYKRL